jgi:hypothetical protein
LENKIAYQLPKICCRCGERQGVKMRLIRDTKISGLGYYVIAVSVKRANFSFGVPVCDECSEILKRSDTNTKIFRIVLCVLVAFVSFSFFNFGGYFYVGLIVSILVYIVAHLIIVNQPINGSPLGGYTGKYFWFTNRKFFKQFSELNPELVSPLHLQQLISQPVSSGFDSTNARPGFTWTRSNKILVFVLLILLICVLAVCGIFLFHRPN